MGWDDDMIEVGEFADEWDEDDWDDDFAYDVWDDDEDDEDEQEIIGPEEYGCLDCDCVFQINELNDEYTCPICESPLLRMVW